MHQKKPCVLALRVCTSASAAIPTMFKSDTQVLHICIALLERRQAPPSGQVGGRGEALRQSVERAAAASAELDSKLEADAVASICHYSACLAALLDTSTQVTQLVSGSA